MWMKKRREELGFSLAELAKRLTDAGVSRTGAALGNWEANDHVPLLSRPEHARALADVLQMDLSEMMLEAGFDLDLTVQGKDVPANIRHFLAQYDNLTRYEKQTVSRVLDVIAEELISLRGKNQSDSNDNDNT
jgi:transcriptional regulator with XRE-family HTH domain